MLSLYVKLMTAVQNPEKGAVASEYAILLALIAVVLVGAITGLQGAIAGALNGAAGAIN